MRFSRADWLIVSLIVVLTLAVYAQTASFEFIHYDDAEYVFENHRVREGLSARGAIWAFTTYELANWHPLTWLSYMLDAELFGVTPPHAGPFHLVNVALHVCNALLLFALLRTMTQSRWRSGLVAALFALHPLHVESVAWVAERKDVLSTLLGLSAMLAYVRWARRGTPGSYLAMLFLFALSLLAKPMLVTLPFVLLLLDYWPLERLRRVKLWVLALEKLPLLALALISCWVTVVAQRAGGAMTELHRLPIIPRLGNAATSYVHYLLDTFWPARLAILYPFPRPQFLEVIVASAAALLIITYVVARFQPRYRHLAVGWLWYLGTLIPVIGLVAVGEQARADRYTYFPLIGVFIMIAWSIPSPRSRPWAITAGVCAAAVVAALSVQSWRQVRLWRSSETLFSHALSIVGDQPTLLLNAGVARADRGDYAGALEHFRAVLRLRPRYVQGINNVGNMLARQGKFDEAIVYYRRAIEVRPGYATSHYNLGTTLGQLGRMSEAEQALREALRLRPDFPAARHNLNNALIAQGKPPEM